MRDSPFEPEVLFAARRQLWLIGSTRHLVDVDPQTRRVSDPRTFHIEVEYAHFAGSDGDAAFFTGDGAIARLDPETLDVDVFPYSVTAAPAAMYGQHACVAAHQLWIGGRYADEILVMDPRSGEVMRRIGVPRHYRGLAVQGGTIATFDALESAVVLLDSTSGHEVYRHEVPHQNHKVVWFSVRPGAIFAWGNGAWTSSHGQQETSVEVHAPSILLAFDPRTRRMRDERSFEHSIYRVLAGREHTYVSLVPQKGPGTRGVLALPAHDGSEAGSIPFERAEMLAEINGSEWILVPRTAGMETGSLVELDSSGSVVGEADLATIRVTPRLPPPLDPSEYERRFVEALRSDLSGYWRAHDEITGEEIRERPAVGADRELVDVRSRGTYPDTEVIILFRDDKLPGCLIGLRKRLWGWEWDDEAAQRFPEEDVELLVLNTFNEWPPVHTPSRCAPDGEGITWTTHGAVSPP